MSRLKICSTYCGKKFTLHLTNIFCLLPIKRLIMKKVLFSILCISLIVFNSCEDSILDSIIPTESNFEWAQSCAGNSAHGRDIAVDSDGNVYVVGNFNQEVKFDSITIQTNEESGSFLVKYSPDGNSRWIRYVERPSYISSVSTDMLGNILNLENLQLHK